jgi:hypothetical protein
MAVVASGWRRCMNPSQRTRFVPFVLVCLRNLGRGGGALEVGRESRIDAWEREFLEEVEQGSGISRSDGGIEMEGRCWP